MPVELSLTNLRQEFSHMLFRDDSAIAIVWIDF